jgi:hypothetical protein
MCRLNMATCNALRTPSSSSLWSTSSSTTRTFSLSYQQGSRNPGRWAVRPKATWLNICSHNFVLSLEQTPTMPAIILNLVQIQGLHAGASFSAHSAKFNSIMRRKHIQARCWPPCSHMITWYCTLHDTDHQMYIHAGLDHGPVVRAIFSRSLLSLLQGWLSILYVCMYCTYVRAYIITALLLFPMPQYASSAPAPANY